MMDQSALVLGMTLVLLLGQTSGTVVDIISSTPDLEVGHTHMLLCKVGAEGKITWQKNDKEIDDIQIVHQVDETSSQLNILSATLEDAGRYTCLCELDSGVDVQTSLTIFVHEGPSFNATKEYHEFLIGQDVEVPCLVSGRPSVQVSWWRDQREIITHDGESIQHLQNNSLLIKGVRKQDAGTYYCKAQIIGRPVLKKLAISVVVNVPPSVHIKEAEKKVMAGADTNISLQCFVEGLPAPNISWITPGGPDPARHQYNSDRSQLTVRAVSRADDGKYVCTASNKIGGSNGSIVLHVSEAPRVYLSAEVEAVPLGHNVSLSCNVSGYPYPQLSWINKQSRKTVDSTSGRVQVQDGVLTITEVAPSDGGLYSCMAVSSSGNASKDVAVCTQPGPPRDVSISSKATSFVISLKSQPINGGTPITSFLVQLRWSTAEKWAESFFPRSDTFTIPSLRPYTGYSIRLAAINLVGLGLFSSVQQARTQGIREPDCPVLSSEQMKMDQNALSVPVILLDSGSSPLLHYKIRYRQEKEGAEWREEQQPADPPIISLSDLTFGATYHMEVMAVNANGTSSPANLSFTAPEQAAGITKGGVVSIIMVIFLVLLIVVDATCCYTKRCGILMTIATKVFGRRFRLEKRLEEGEQTNGDLHLKGMDTPRGSINQPQTKERKLNSEITYDKAPLTKHETGQPRMHEVGHRT